MMIATTCLLVTLTILIHGQVGNSHVATFRQATDSLKSSNPRISVGEMNDPLEFDEGSGIMEAMINVGECLGDGNQIFGISLPNPSGCNIFQTTGFNSGGYPNNSGSSSQYNCIYVLEFEATANGTVTVKEKDFQFQEDLNGFCSDHVTISNVIDEQQEIDNSDSEDLNTGRNVVKYCGTITEDKIRDFSTDELVIQLIADNTENGNGAEIVICID
ncbi:uncharacterized protein LOC131892149 [Tigriopus californicus]|uniref:uncharacterized protein LOC131892149 n=1 Tax=Tigriopus californicus TaxID=6832 RepID=UPI0027DAA29D|nr:uncharacterized protein LOC131892149 [Tigriopus californicus]